MFSEINYLSCCFSWYDPLGSGSLPRRRPTNRTSSLKGGTIPQGGRSGPLVAPGMHKKLVHTNSYHSNIVCYCIYFIFKLFLLPLLSSELPEFLIIILQEVFDFSNL